jgi:D-glycero-beta-D-manno-heptose-7-phosphate kinase
MTDSHCADILKAAARTRIVVVGDVILDHFIWGNVARISPEAPVPVVDFTRESLMPGGAANVARNVAAFGAQASIFGATGRDEAAAKLARLLEDEKVNVHGLVACSQRYTTTKVRIVSGQQQIARVDRETVGDMTAATREKLARRLDRALDRAQAVIVGDYGKGVVSQGMLDQLKRTCRRRGIWLSLDPKPTRALDLQGMSLLTPNRRETFQLAELPDVDRHLNPLRDRQLRRAIVRLMEKFHPTVLLVTLSELGMLVCLKDQAPIHIPTVAKEVFDVSGAGDTVIATFTLAIVAGATPAEAAVFSNHAAGVVVGKVGTATVTASELMASFRNPASIEAGS